MRDLKDSITLYVRNISNDKLRSAVKQAVHRLMILQLDEGNLIKHLSFHRERLADMNVWYVRIKCVKNVYFVSFPRIFHFTAPSIGVFGTFFFFM